MSCPQIVALFPWPLDSCLPLLFASFIRPSNGGTNADRRHFRKASRLRRKFHCPHYAISVRRRPVFFAWMVWHGPETRFFRVFGSDLINTPLQRGGGCAGRHETVSTVSRLAFLRPPASTTLNVSPFLLSSLAASCLGDAGTPPPHEGRRREAIGLPHPLRRREKYSHKDQLVEAVRAAVWADLA